MAKPKRSVFYDSETDILYIKLKERVKIAESEEINRGTIVDYDSKGGVVGIEILDISRYIGEAKDAPGA